MGGDETGNGSDVVFTTVDEQVGMVEHVVHLSPELQLEALSKPEVLVNPAVEIPETRATERIPLGHIGRIRAEVVVAGYSVGINQRVGVCQIYVLDMIRLAARVFRIFAASAERDRALRREPRAYRVGIGAVVFGKWVTAVRHEDAGELPAIQYLLGDAVHRLGKGNGPIEPD